MIDRCRTLPALALALEEDGLEDEHVGQVHAALEGIVEGVDIARPHPVAVAGQGRGQGVGEG